MSFDALQDKIKAKKNPTVAGLDARVEYVPPFILKKYTQQSGETLEAAAAVPLERVMIETDSPYMAPVPHRGERCDSGYVSYVCEKLAELKGISPEACAQATLENGRRFFRIP